MKTSIIFFVLVLFTLGAFCQSEICRECETMAAILNQTCAFIKCTEQNVNALVEEVCKEFGVSTELCQMAEDEIDAILKGLENNESPQQICTDIGACANDPSLPNPPIFPTEFSSTVSRYRHGSVPLAGNWYFSVSQNAERFNFNYKNFKDELTYEAFYALFNEQKAYLLTTTGNGIDCKTFNIGNKIEYPTFSGFKYDGQEEIQLPFSVAEVNHWENVTATEGVFNYYDLVTNNTIPVRIQRTRPGDKSEETLTFVTIDIAPQNPSIFTLSDEAKKACA